MNDALGRPDAVLVLGGSSDIATALLRRLVDAGTRRVVLAGRDPDALRARAERFAPAAVSVLPFDAEDPAGHAATVDAAFAGGDLDLVVLAFGQLGDQQRAEADPSHAVTLATVNYVGAVSAGLHVARRLREQGHGTLVVLSSVAGERARRSNFVYGSTKAALDGFCQGLGDALEGTGVEVVVVRPGFVHTKMTEGRTAPPLATTPEAVADAVAAGLATGRHTVWVPGTFRWVMSVFRHLPRPLWRRLSARM